MNKLLIVAQVWPEPDSSAAGSRMMQLITAFLKHGCQITFACTAAESQYAVDLKDLGIKKHNVKVNDGTFDTFLKKENPDVVMFDRFMIEEQFGWRVAENCPKALRVLDTEDLHFLRKARQQAFKENRSLTKDNLFSEVAKREIAAIFRSDLTLVISEAEQNILEKQFKIPNNLLIYLPFLLDQLSANEINALPSFEERKHFISIGNFLHPPNWDKTLYLKEKIWPLVRQEMPEAELHIYGAYASQKVQQLHQPKSGFYIEGRAADAKTVFENARVVLAPLRFGAGLKGKFINAMQAGTPSVTTMIGAEGIGGSLPWSGEIANSPEEIAKAAVMLYKNKKRWEKSQKFGWQIINARFQKAFFADRFIARIEAVLQNLNRHRQQNFMGEMLLHHSMKSTKYMSLWIEAKNKLSKK